MLTGSVLICPPLPGDPVVADPWELAAAVTTAGAVPVLPQGGSGPRSSDDAADQQVRQWLANAGLTLRVANPPAPTLVVLQGTACLRAPDLAVALRGARRRRSGYVLIAGPEPPRTKAEWPDAPVIVINPLDEDAARRRGYRIRIGHPASELAAILSQ